MPDEPAWLSIDPDESIVWSGTPRLFLVVHVAVLALPIPAIAIFFRPSPWIALGGVGSWAVIVATAWVYLRNVEYVVSTEYVYAKRGVLSRSVTQIALGNVQNTTVKQGVFGVLFDHGTVRFSTAGSEGPQLRLFGIRGPLTAKARVDEQLPRGRAGGVGRRSGRGDADADRSGADAEAARSEARAMRATAERIEAALREGQPAGESDSRAPDGPGRGDRR